MRLRGLLADARHIPTMCRRVIVKLGVDELAEEDDGHSGNSDLESAGDVA